MDGPKPLVKTVSVVTFPLKYFVTEVVWSRGVFSEAQMLLNDQKNIIRIKDSTGSNEGHYYTLQSKELSV